MAGKAGFSRPPRRAALILAPQGNEDLALDTPAIIIAAPFGKIAPGIIDVKTLARPFAAPAAAFGRKHTIFPDLDPRR